jgi:hypothetical protein
VVVLLVVVVVDTVVVVGRVSVLPAPTTLASSEQAARLRANSTPDITINDFLMT